MSSTINTRIKVKRDTTQHWNEAIGFIPLQGEIIVYEDYETKTYLLEQDGQTVTETVNIPNIKIGNGNAYVQDLVFVDQKTRELLMEHINNNDIHVTLGNKSFWNNKINVDDAYEQIHDELEDETLILTRN
jgi:hypothetical protein